MTKLITWVGIDDDKMNLTVAVVRGPRQKDPEVRRIPNEDKALGRWVRKLVRESKGGEIRMCYEAGPNGFALMRRLEAMGPASVPQAGGLKVRTQGTSWYEGGTRRRSWHDLEVPERTMRWGDILSPRC